METAIKLENVNKSFGKGIGKVQVLKNVNFTADLGELCLVLGPSGSGKSTFLTIAGGLQTPDSGKVIVDGQDFLSLPSKKRDQFRLNKIGFILQSYNLLPYLNIADQFKLVQQVKEDGNMDQEEFHKLLDELGIEKLLKQYPAELSGGQNQRVAIARALYTEPQIILADEPTSALDSDRVEMVGKLLKDLATERNKAVIVVTHDLRLRQFADKIYQLEDGKLKREKVYQ
ncbi:ABC transporter ATP-binding protein [Limosilactobacillus portuensis]|jgi:putative ABC transport system ATP-binding protein|uniref:Putative hemin import ATP-binding protein HrtA n=1 Tax=Limosilactobacillus portuensis TaxID=2742601 RepID=A0ABS6IW69_9LACO|nr:ABC transporter ATP-binding protein [Limosilactobacillus portuensis]MBU9694410.1 ABC transporter ATP-binding protein [Limosilactobacillus portuensis]MDU1505197.1 ABC transporter ATP-binding protein [Limosilactobacillus vaginalis]PMC28440.1 ABC transporter ATP-binding protein [Gardnerella vaginalis]WCT60650.1 ABC transporter ATP-binding protein [Limosilactobacillus portuensis]